MMDVGNTNLDKQAELDVRNSFDKTITVVLEPWAEEFELEPDEKIAVVAYSDIPGTIEVIYGKDTLTVYLWTGSTFSVDTDR